MSPSDWITLASVALALVLQSIGVAVFITRTSSQGQTNATSIEWLGDHKVSKEEGAGLAAHLTRLDREGGERERRLNEIRHEMDDRATRLARLEEKAAVCERQQVEDSGRIERLTDQIKHEAKNRAAETSAVASALGDLKASVAALKEAVNARHTQSPMELVTMLSLAVQAAPILKQLLSQKAPA